MSSASARVSPTKTQPKHGVGAWVGYQDRDWRVVRVGWTSPLANHDVGEAYADLMDEDGNKIGADMQIFMGKIESNAPNKPHIGQTDCGVSKSKDNDNSSPWRISHQLTHGSAVSVKHLQLQLYEFSWSYFAQHKPLV
eukprot:SAG11_NODE_40_length_21525_cov_16.276066_1_plen_138_part_00